jgi:hypothetical protein
LLLLLLTLCLLLLLLICLFIIRQWLSILYNIKITTRIEGISNHTLLQSELQLICYLRTWSI